MMIAKISTVWKVSKYGVYFWSIISCIWTEYRDLRHGVVVITTEQLHSTKPQLRFCAGSNPAHGVLEIPNGEDLWQWPWLEIRLNTFHQSTILQKQFIIITLFMQWSLHCILKYNVPICCPLICFPTSVLMKFGAYLSTCVFWKVGKRCFPRHT